MEENTNSSKINKLYLSFIALIIIMGVLISIYFGIQPKTIPKIKISGVGTADEFGAAIFHRLRQEISGAQVVLLGIEPDYNEQKLLGRGFVNAVRQEQLDFITVADFRFGLKEVLSADEVVNPEVSASDVANSLQYVIKMNKRPLLVVPVGNTSHLIHRNLVNLLRTNQSIKNVLAISVSFFPLSRQEESQFNIFCKNDVADPTGFGNFGCMVLSKARNHYFKKPPEKPVVGLMDQIGIGDYLVLLRQR